MKTQILKLRNHHKLTSYLVFFIFSSAMLGISLQLIRAFLYEEKVAALATTFAYFTTQSNLLVGLVTLLFLLGFHEEKWFINLSFITLINIAMTGIIFHALLTPYMAKIDILQHILHTANPIFYTLFFFLILKHSVSIKQAWLGLIYPFFFLVLVYTFIEPVLGNLLEISSPNFESARYVYPFLDPNQYDRGYWGLLIFNLGIIAPLILIFGYFLSYMKIKFEKKISL